MTSVHLNTKPHHSVSDRGVLECGDDDELPAGDLDPELDPEQEVLLGSTD